MAAASAVITLSFFFLAVISSLSAASPPYLSAATLFKDYQNMLTTFKIFIYTPPKPFNFTSGPASLFHSSLIRSRFVTQNPNEAHLFFVPFPADTSPRALARLVRDLRSSHLYWDRSLGADHFFLSPAGIDYSSERNVLELKKNAVQISVFPVTSGYFVPHKDITLPPVNPSPPHAAEENSSASFLGYLKWDGKTESNLVSEMKGLDEFFLIEEESKPLDFVRSARKSRFCLFLYHADVAGIVEAMRLGCVPVVIVDRPIQDLPLMDVLRWSDMVLLVAARSAGRLKEVLSGVGEDKYGEMREMCVAASKHLVWNEEAAQPYDAFHMVVYQLWLRRHVVRYARREFDA